MDNSICRICDEVKPGLYDIFRTLDGLDFRANDNKNWERINSREEIHLSERVDQILFRGGTESLSLFKK